MKQKIRSKKSNITFIIFTHNEEKRISFPIRCYLPYGDVLISDDSSTDNTVKIAKSLGARVIKRKTHEAVIVENKEEADFIYNHVNTDWVFWGFADEIVPKTCLNLYKKISRENKYKVVVQKRKTLMYDAESEFYSGGSNAIKFFQKDAIDYTDNKIHQSGKFASHVKPDEILYLPPLDEDSVYHFHIFTTDVQLKNTSSYYLVQAKTIPYNISSLKIVLNPLIIFLTVYFLQGAWKLGIKGFIAAMQAMFYSFVVLTKAWELNKDINWETMEEKYRIAKKKLLISSPKSNIRQKVSAYISAFFLSRLHKWYKYKK